MIRKSIGFLLAFLMFIFPILWNFGKTEIEIAPSHVGTIVKSSPNHYFVFSNEGAKQFKVWIETKTRPSYNPLTIWKAFLQYNLFTENYDMVTWVDTDSYSSENQYTLYQDGEVAFLRIEYDGPNQVLITDFTHEELFEILKRFESTSG